MITVYVLIITFKIIVITTLIIIVIYFIPYSKYYYPYILYRSGGPDRPLTKSISSVFGPIKILVSCYNRCPTVPSVRSIITQRIMAKFNIERGESDRASLTGTAPGGGGKSKVRNLFDKNQDPAYRLPFSRSV